MIASLSPARAPALPIGPPSVSLADAEAVAGTPVTVRALAHDPDGTVTAMKVCVPDGPCAAATNPPPDAVGSLRACVEGGDGEAGIAYTFPAAGTYLVRVAASGTVCPGLDGRTETTDVTLPIHVVPRPEIHIACNGTGGITDVGVSAGSIKIGVTVARTGIGSSFLGETADAIRAVADAVNRSGGICKRMFALRIVDDSWDPVRGKVYIDNLIAEGIFALVSASSEGLRAASLSGDIDAAGIPVVSDGLMRTDGADPWIWPVGPSTAAGVHSIARSAYDRGARTFGLVYDENFHHGVEARDALAEAISHLPGASVVAEAPIYAGAASYDVTGFALGCLCDAVVMATLASSARAWFASGGPKGRMLTALTSMSMNARAARDCGALCSGVEVWGGFAPPLSGELRTPGADLYAELLLATNPAADVANVHTETAFAQTLFLARQIGRVGGTLTRAGLRAALNSARFNAGISHPLTWTAGEHAANRWSRAFALEYFLNDFTGFSPRGGWVEDPWPHG